MKRVYNFSAGPAVLPEEVLKEAADEMMNYEKSGMSVMEISHRTELFRTIIEEAEQDLRDLMHIPDNYRVLFVQGGGHMQFAMVPMNLMKNGKADYLVSGLWSKKAEKEAEMYGDVRIAASGEADNFTSLPDLRDVTFRSDADYVYLCLNNTIYGTLWHELPETGDIPLAADISSCFLSEPLDVSRFGLLWGGVQKNVGPAGMAIVIVREDLIREDVWPGTPTMLRYRTYADSNSLYNTPPVYCIYICGKVFRWLKQQGGLEEMKKINQEKADLLYDYLDHSRLFRPIAAKKDRSLMNVTFTSGDAETDARFVKEAEAKGLMNLKGHRSTGGMRASIYNAMPVEGVRALVSFMKEFENAE